MHIKLTPYLLAFIGLTCLSIPLTAQHYILPEVRAGRGWLGDARDEAIGVYGLGANYGYAFDPHLMLTGGIRYMEFGFETVMPATFGSDFDPQTGSFREQVNGTLGIRSRSRNFALPVGARYTFLDKRWSPYLTATAAPTLEVSQQTELIVNHPLEQSSSVGSARVNTPTFIGELGVGLHGQFAERIGMFVQPTYRFRSGGNTTGLRLQASDVVVGMSIRLNEPIE